MTELDTSLCSQKEGKHVWECIDHYGHPTGEQMCLECISVAGGKEDDSCPVGRNHPDAHHVEQHLDQHKSDLSRGLECWCVKAKAEATP